MGGSFETGEREEQLRRRRGSPRSITAAVHNRLQLAQGYNWRWLIYLLFLLLSLDCCTRCKQRLLLLQSWPGSQNVTTFFWLPAIQFHMMTKLGPSNGIMTGASGKNGQLCGSRKLACSQTSTALTHLLATEELLDLFLGPLESYYGIWPKNQHILTFFWELQARLFQTGKHLLRRLLRCKGQRYVLISEDHNWLVCISV